MLLTVERDDYVREDHVAMVEPVKTYQDQTTSTNITIYSDLIMLV